ncbi:hypothetical protein [Microbispora triticiradicis]|uniref:hypothetical protein n=1 Tax=Microbispora triticiradicis TaxID=2200763 RepID=UPI001AD6CE04|nr:hypothetical protein [Microbispora triticiradicis]MBO4274797.1 hypothetical protein [Microbispora triticiradicis]
MAPLTRRMPLLPAAVLITFLPMPAFAGSDLDLPTARAFDGARPLPSVRPVTEYCAANPGACRFTVHKAGSGDFYSTVRSLGNAAINCTDDNITVERQITLRTGSADNLGGEITGKIAVEGQLNASGEVSAAVNAEGSGSFDTPNKQQGPSATFGAKAGANGSGKVGGSLGLKGAFEGAFKLAYQHTWTSEHTESTTYTTVVRPGDALVFGASAAMQRVAGTITAPNGLSVRDVVVTGPSTVNTSTFVAETFVVGGNTCEQVHPHATTAADDNVNQGGRRVDAMTPLSTLPPGARLRERTVLPFRPS